MTKQKIEHPHLILCEGVDAKLFLINFVNHIFGEAQIDFQVEDFGGTTDLKKYIKTLPELSGFEIVKSITILRDAEKNAKGADQSVHNVLNNNNFAVPKKPCEIAVPVGEQHPVKAAYALFPDFNSVIGSGTLEDLCLEILTHEKKDEILAAADCAVRSAMERTGKFTREHKNRLHTYLSLTDDCVGLKIGESAKANAFDFNADKLKPLKQLLNDLMKDKS